MQDNVFYLFRQCSHAVTMMSTPTHSSTSISRRRIQIIGGSQTRTPYVSNFLSAAIIAASSAAIASASVVSSVITDRLPNGMLNESANWPHVAISPGSSPPIPYFHITLMSHESGEIAKYTPCGKHSTIEYGDVGQFHKPTRLQPSLAVQFTGNDCGYSHKQAVSPGQFDVNDRVKFFGHKLSQHGISTYGSQFSLHVAHRTLISMSSSSLYGSRSICHE